MSEFDAILGGASHNSLACAAHLASKGWKVAIFEANATAGGAVRTSELTLPGFRPDFGAMNLSLFAGSPFHRKYANELKAAGLELVPVADCSQAPFPIATVSASASTSKKPSRESHLIGAATWPGAGTGAGTGFMLAQQLTGS